VRVATFNLLHGRSIEDGRVDLDRLAGAVAGLDADVLGLQEVDRDQPRSHGADLTAVAAEAMGAVEARFVPTVVGTPGETWTAAEGDEGRGRPTYGVALLSRRPVLSWQVLSLPPAPVRVPLWVAGARRPLLVRDEPRAAVLAVIEGPAGPVTMCTTHLSYVPGWNGRQLRRVAGALTGPVALLGDLNMDRRPAARASGLSPVDAGPTYPAPRPRRRLDHVLLGGGPVPAGPAETPRLPLSDHRALVVDVHC
jgi:endonuclease/exonuclease/phosphatase family metal-dependent hydrolase